MALITPAKSAASQLVSPLQLTTETMTFDNADDLDLGLTPADYWRTIMVTVTSAVSDAASISDGIFAGQRVTFVVVNATNVFGLPIALGNVTGGTDIDVSLDAPQTIVWDGTNWHRAGQ